MIKREKRGLSPVIATVLLVSLALVLAVIVFLWARAFIPDAVEKEGQSIDLACEQTHFFAEAFGGNERSLTIENTGDIPIWGAEIRKKQIIGEIVQAEQLDKVNLEGGQTGRVNLPNGIETDDQILVIPILLGRDKDGTKPRTYPCNEDAGVEIVVKNI